MEKLKNHSTSRPWEQWDKDGMAKLIDSIWTKDVSGFELLHRRNLARLVNTYYRQSMESVVELGCGSGLVYEELVPSIISNKVFLGIDVSNEMLKIARKRYPQGKFEYGDIFKLDFPDQTSDLVLCFEVVIHLPDIQIPITEMLRIAKKRVIFTAWIAEEENISLVRIGDTEFIHHRYDYKEVLKIIHEKAGNRPHSIEIRILTDEVWAFIISFENNTSNNIIPFPGFTNNFRIESSKQIYTSKCAIEAINEEIKQNYLPLEQVKQNYLPLEQVKQNYLPLEQVKQNYLPLEQVKQNYLPLEQVKHNFVARSRVLKMAYELDLYRSSKIISLFRWFRPVSDLVHIIENSHFIPFFDDSKLFDNVNGYKLHVSPDLNSMAFLPYSIKLNRGYLSGLQIVLMVDIPNISGEIGVEIVSQKSKILLRKTFPIKMAFDTSIVNFTFNPLSESAEPIELRIFTKGADFCTRILEWQKPGFNRSFIKRKPFFNYSFTE